MSGSLLSRNQLQGYQVSKDTPVVRSGYTSPISQGIKNPYVGKKLTPKVLVDMLFHFHTVKGLKPHRSNKKAYWREASIFLQRYSPDIAEKVMVQAANTCQHSWGFIHLTTLAKKRLEERRTEPSCQNQKLNKLPLDFL